MNVLIINGSPRGKGSNSLRLAHAFAEGMAQAAEVHVEELQLSSMNIRPCLGCFTCWRKTPGSCCIQDDMGGVIDKLLWADVTLWSFPLYYFSVPGTLKVMIDRILPMVMPFMDRDAAYGGHPSRYDLTDKRNVLISTCGFYTAENNYDGVTAIFDHLWQGNYETVFCGQGELFRVPQLKDVTEPYLRNVRQAGAEFAAGSISETTKENLKQLLLPRDVFERMADGSWNG